VSALALAAVSKHVGGVAIARDVTLRLEPGERRALLGPNGAGKTTLMNIAAGFLRPSAGRVVLGDRDVTRMAPHRRARRGLARTFQITNLLPALTVAENLALAVQSESRQRWNPVRGWRGVAPIWSEVDELLDRADLHDVRDTRVRELPYGRQRRLEIIVAIARPSSVILLDEPGAGLASDEAEELMELVFGLGSELAVLFIDHDVELALRLATRVTVLHLGGVVAEGTPEEIRRSGVLDDIYLGTAHA
jgi:ABC-type branched-subunit amino acid transport system ATPase component